MKHAFVKLSADLANNNKHKLNFDVKFCEWIGYVPIQPNAIPNNN